MTKKLFFILSFSLLAVSVTTAQQEKGIVGEKNWLNFWTDFRGKPDIRPEPTQILSGELTGGTVKLEKQEVYLLLGDVFVTDSTALVIEPGTLILADKKTKASLIISSGSTIEASGTQTDPIVFTSNSNSPKAGDWGGIFILGDAPSNRISNSNVLRCGLRSDRASDLLYGGSSAQGNSGTMDFVRIEYAGKRTKEYGFYSALNLYAIGDSTQISNVMVSHSKGDSFFVSGGKLNLSKLVSYKASRSDFVFNYGTQTTIDNSLAVRSPYSSASVGSPSMLVTSQGKGNEGDIKKAQTFVQAKNLTLLNISNNLKSAIDVGLVHESIYIDANAWVAIDQSVISGFNPAVVFNKHVTLNDENLNRLKFTEMYFNSCEGNIFIENYDNNEDLENWYGNSSFQNVYSKGEDKNTFIDPQNLRSPDFRLRINKIIASSSNN